MAANARFKFASRRDFESRASVEQVYQCAEDLCRNAVTINCNIRAVFNVVMPSRLFVFFGVFCLRDLAY